MARLSGWEEIKEYTKRSQSTIRKWVKVHNFPIVKLCGCVESDTDLIDKWFKVTAESMLNSESSGAKG